MIKTLLLALLLPASANAITLNRGRITEVAVGGGSLDIRPLDNIFTARDEFQAGLWVSSQPYILFSSAPVYLASDTWKIEPTIDLSSLKIWRTFYHSTMTLTSDGSGLLVDAPKFNASVRMDAPLMAGATAQMTQYVTAPLIAGTTIQADLMDGATVQAAFLDAVISDAILSRIGGVTSNVEPLTGFTASVRVLGGTDSDSRLAASFEAGNNSSIVIGFENTVYDTNYIANLSTRPLTIAQLDTGGTPVSAIHLSTTTGRISLNAATAYADADLNINSGGNTYHIGYDGTPVMGYGGNYVKRSGGACQVADPITTSCTCPASFTDTLLQDGAGCPTSGDVDCEVHVCWRN